MCLAYLYLLHLNYVMWDINTLSFIQNAYIEMCSIYVCVCVCQTLLLKAFLVKSFSPRTIIRLYIHTLILCTYEMYITYLETEAQYMEWSQVNFQKVTPTFFCIYYTFHSAHLHCYTISEVLLLLM